MPISKQGWSNHFDYTAYPHTVSPSLHLATYSQRKLKQSEVDFNIKKRQKKGSDNYPDLISIGHVHMLKYHIIPQTCTLLHINQNTYKDKEKSEFLSSPYSHITLHQSL
jgi:UDP-2,3-diacylglucosamine pyrophosphatase LpxH